VAILEINHKWTSDGSSGGLTAVEVGSAALHSALYLQTSTLASTWSFEFQTAPSSAGPWVTEASTSVSTNNAASAQYVLRVTGPYQWMRPYSGSASTGTHVFRLIAVG
jgi:hypothetical protein